MRQARPAIPHCTSRPLWDTTRSFSSSRSTAPRSEEHTSELQSPCNLVCRLLLEKKKNIQHTVRDLFLSLSYNNHTSVSSSSMSLRPVARLASCSRPRRYSEDPLVSRAHHLSTV